MEAENDDLKLRRVAAQPPKITFKGCSYAKKISQLAS